MVSVIIHPGSKAWSSIGFSDFNKLPTVSNWLNVAGMVGSLSLLLSFLILPVERTSRHYLTVGLVLAVSVLQVIYYTDQIEVGSLLIRLDSLVSSFL